MDRNLPFDVIRPAIDVSLSARRAWIEIITVIRTPIGCVSLSARRAWIEILFGASAPLWGVGRSPQGERG